ncbi:TPA: LPS export ABC transporter ATP-binding protein [Neisseria meningitidis]|nr:LPS export ABC transporter ATP-binding protein [Neisseria meningitidis]ADZ00885.1 lipopolysaccharide ABC transporter, ATP-binding protein [Neisseria meningitidis M04-240196]MBG8681720.1 LPS export ABC transporter ATP-binding protein [Neisseria meningitidis]MBG8825833.1 LPS export ABC transporter ATP-binding protein [Neisseria meningitidis]MCV6687891.1 LPS export ABC transporter ATP-binding protein [Neisseria meningitidis]MCV6691889.1 LPS export ABC transporter ATP-binding protein [Neisseria
MSANVSRLVVQNLQKSFKKRQVVKSFSLEIESGEVVGLLGPNGAGKTTSFYMIVGLIAADAGSVTLDGQELRHLPIHERARLGVGYLPQEASIFRKMTVEQNIRAILEIRTKDKNQIDREIEKLLADLNIERLRNNPAPSLSGGERRRVEIARVLAMKPHFILLDEPFAGVDPIAVIDIQKIIGFLKSRGIGVLITDHNVRETLSICDRAYIISDGTVLASGKPDDLVGNEQVRSVYLGENFKY